MTTTIIVAIVLVIISTIIYTIAVVGQDMAKQVNDQAEKVRRLKNAIRQHNLHCDENSKITRMEDIRYPRRHKV